ncbi:MAG: hypothetical protein ABJN36_18080 [Cyclobacteriaceae bacterium]
MDELKELWVEIRSNDDLQLLNSKDISDATKAKSGTVISKLRSNVFNRFIFCAIMLTVFLVAIPVISVLSVQILLVILMAAYLIGAMLYFTEHRKLQPEVQLDQNIHKALSDCRNQIQSIIKIEEAASLVLFPVSASAGFLLGMYLKDPQTGFLNEPMDWYIFLGLMVLFVPLSHLLNKRMNNYSFGKHLKDLNQNISELEEGT